MHLLFVKLKARKNHSSNLLLLLFLLLHFSPLILFYICCFCFMYITLHPISVSIVLLLCDYHTQNALNKHTIQLLHQNQVLYFLIFITNTHANCSTAINETYVFTIGWYVFTKKKKPHIHNNCFNATFSVTIHSHSPNYPNITLYT